MKRISSDIVIKILILLCFGIFYFKIIKNNEIIMYVHPRIIPFAILGMLAMFAIALFLITDSRRTKKKNTKLRNYVVFIIPLVMVFFMQSTSANSSIKTDDIGANFSGSLSSNLIMTILSLIPQTKRSTMLSRVNMMMIYILKIML